MSKLSTPKKAFIRSEAGYEFNGKKLQPFSAMRQSAASSMGLRFGLVDENDIFTITVEELKGKKKQKRDLQFYNQLFSDVVTVIWLCSVPDSRVLRAMRRLDEGKVEAFKWADQNGIGLLTAKYYEAAGVFLLMMQDVIVSTGVPEGAEQAEEDDDPND